MLLRQCVPLTLLFVHLADHFLDFLLA
jgi:hypothetical protein